MGCIHISFFFTDEETLRTCSLKMLAPSSTLSLRTFLPYGWVKTSGVIQRLVQYTNCAISIQGVPSCGMIFNLDVVDNMVHIVVIWLLYPWSIWCCISLRIHDIFLCCNCNTLSKVDSYLLSFAISAFVEEKTQLSIIVIFVSTVQ